MDEFYRLGRTQTIDFTSTQAGVTSVFDVQTRAIRLVANAYANYHIYDAGASSVVSSADPLLPTQIVEVVQVTPGQSITAIKASGGSITSADGRMTVTELV